jgi:hypothetical protein
MAAAMGPVAGRRGPFAAALGEQRARGSRLRLRPCVEATSQNFPPKKRRNLGFCSFFIVEVLGSHPGSRSFP